MSTINIGKHSLVSVEDDQYVGIDADHLMERIRDELSDKELYYFLCDLIDGRDPAWISKIVSVLNQRVIDLTVQGLNI